MPLYTLRKTKTQNPVLTDVKDLEVVYIPIWMENEACTFEEFSVF